MDIFRSVVTVLVMFVFTGFGLLCMSATLSYVWTKYFCGYELDYLGTFRKNFAFGRVFFTRAEDLDSALSALPVHFNSVFQTGVVSYFFPFMMWFFGFDVCIMGSFHVGTVLMSVAALSLVFWLGSLCLMLAKAGVARVQACPAGEQG